MTSVLRFPLPTSARRGLAGSDMVVDVYYAGMMRHWPAGRRALARLARLLHGAACAWQMRRHAGSALRWGDLSDCWRLGLLPKELIWARDAVPGGAGWTVMPDHVKKGIAHLLNPNAFPLSGNILLDKARFDELARKAGLPLPPTFGAESLERGIPDWAEEWAALIFKPGFSSQGRGIERLDRTGDGSWRIGGSEPVELLAWARANLRQGDVVQALLAPHASLADRSPGALPTLRVVTCLDERGEPEVTDAILRMGGGQTFLDNFHGGGIAAPVDLATGRTRRAMRREPSMHLVDQPTHPATGAPLIGVEIPDFAASLDIARRAHRAVQSFGITTVGWDIGLAEGGPVLIEGNWEPGSDILQFVAGRGIGETRLGELWAHHLKRLPAERWQEAKVLTRSSRRAAREQLSR